MRCDHTLAKGWSHLWLPLPSEPGADFTAYPRRLFCFYLDLPAFLLQGSTSRVGIICIAVFIIVP